MSTIHFTKTTTATPAQFVAALTDFGPGRKELFPNSSDKDLKVHSQGPATADVTEGNGGIWERLTYDWSDPGPDRPDDHRLQHLGRRVGPHLHVDRATPTGRPNIDVVVVRDGKNLKGKAARRGSSAPSARAS